MIIRVDKGEKRYTDEAVSFYRKQVTNFITSFSTFYDSKEKGKQVSCLLKIFSFEGNFIIFLDRRLSRPFKYRIPNIWQRRRIFYSSIASDIVFNFFYLVFPSPLFSFIVRNSKEEKFSKSLNQEYPTVERLSPHYFEYPTTIPLKFEIFSISLDKMLKKKRH